MSYMSRTKDIINACGSETQIVLDSGTINTIASIQPLRYKSKADLNDEYVSAGFSDKSRYLYVGPADVRVDTYPIDTIIKNTNGDYVLKSAGKFCYKNEILYIWAVLEAQT